MGPWAEGPEQEENFEATLRVITRFSAALFVTQSVVCGPASTLSPGSLEGRVSGPISDLMNWSLHYSEVLGHWHAHSSLRSSALITSMVGTKVLASLSQEGRWSSC